MIFSEKYKIPHRILYPIETKNILRLIIKIKKHHVFQNLSLLLNDFKPKFAYILTLKKSWGFIPNCLGSRFLFTKSWRVKKVWKEYKDCYLEVFERGFWLLKQRPVSWDNSTLRFNLVKQIPLQTVHDQTKCESSIE